MLIASMFRDFLFMCLIFFLGYLFGWSDRDGTLTHKQILPWLNRLFWKLSGRRPPVIRKRTHATRTSDTCRPPGASMPLTYNDSPGRWELGFRNIVSILVGARAEFDIPDIVEMVRELKSKVDTNEC